MTTLKQRLLKRCVIRESGCWEPRGHQGAKYSGISVDGTKRGIHIVSYEAFVAPIPDGMEIDHICRNPRCYNPNHLEAVPHKINFLRGNHPSALTHRTGVCKAGHDLIQVGVYVNKMGHRQCKQCRRLNGLRSAKRHRIEIRARQAKYREPKKAAFQLLVNHVIVALDFLAPPKQRPVWIATKTIAESISQSSHRIKWAMHHLGFEPKERSHHQPGGGKGWIIT